MHPSYIHTYIHNYITYIHTYICTVNGIHLVFDPSEICKGSHPSPQGSCETQLASSDAGKQRWEGWETAGILWWFNGI